LEVGDTINGKPQPATVSGLGKTLIRKPANLKTVRKSTHSDDKAKLEREKEALKAKRDAALKKAADEKAKALKAKKDASAKKLAADKIAAALKAKNLAISKK
jgi:hypothetical protein